MTDPVSVPCNCPGTPHEADLVVLREHVSVPMGMAAHAAIRAAGYPADREGVAAAVFLRFGVESWNKVQLAGDPKDPQRTEPVPVTPENAERLLPFAEGGMEVAEIAGDLYAEELFRPLVRAIAKHSGNGQTENSTPPSVDGGSPPLTPLPPSSPPDTDGIPSEVPVP